MSSKTHRRYAQPATSFSPEAKQDAFFPPNNIQMKAEEKDGEMGLTDFFQQGTFPFLQMGAIGPAVHMLQKGLNYAGMTPLLKTDSIFGPKTRQNVYSFQQQEELQVDGLVGNQTWGTLQQTVTGGGTSAPDNPLGTQTNDTFGKILDPSHAIQTFEEVLGLTQQFFLQIVTTPPGQVMIGEALSKMFTDDPSQFGKFLLLPGELSLIVESLDILLRAAQMRKKELNQLPPKHESDHFGNLRDRIVALRTYYQDQLDKQQSGGTTDKPLAQRVVSIALSQVGTVEAGSEYAIPGKHGGMSSPSNVPGIPFKWNTGLVRKGYQRIGQFFSTATGNANYSKPGSTIERLQVKHRVSGPDSRSTSGKSSDVLPSWCGIYLFWVLRSAGLAINDWDVRKGNSQFKKGFTTFTPGSGTSPQPGDIGNITNRNHYFLVVKVEGDKLWTVDANSPSASSTGFLSGKVIFNKSKRRTSTTRAFYRHNALK
ncbi:MAG: peptidoglycan-binding domain-containing protein [Bacteroidota bacterium]